VRLAFLLVAFVALAIIVKISQIQFIEGEKWRKKAEQRDVQFKIIKAKRGSIFGQEGTLLATSLPFYRVAIDPTAPKDALFEEGLDSLSLELAKVFKKYAAPEYKKMLRDARKNKKRYFPLSNEHVDYRTKKYLETLPILREGKFRGGAIFEVENRRFMPFNQLAARTVGYTNQESNLGVVGLEYSFDKYLAGKNGQALFQNMGAGLWKPLSDGSNVMPEDGLDVVSTIDINVQDVAQSALQEALEANDADFGCAIVMEVKSGEIKAMANLGKIKDGFYAENYNYAIGDRGSTDPGSVFKLASFMALLEDKKITLEQKVETGNGQYKFYTTVLNDPKPLGTITAREVFEQSSSIGTARLVQDAFRASPQRFINYLHQFGLSTPLHFQLIGGANPYIKNTNDPTWSIISLPWMSIGYETKISPLQMLVFYNSVANKGKMIQPLIVKEVKRGDKVVERFEAVVLRDKICSDATLEQVNELLKGVVQRGTARSIRSKNYEIAGKTSTSQKFKNGKYVKAYHTAFAGYFPADAPKYSCIVIIDHPKGDKQFGGDVAAPVFKAIADKLYAQDLSMQAPSEVLEKPSTITFVPYRAKGTWQDLRTISNFLEIEQQASALPAEAVWVEGRKKMDNTLEWTQWPLSNSTMPDVRGLSLKDALYILENKGLKVSFEGRGKVKTQSIKPQSTFRRGAKITLQLE
jgi:cell division protein FtsI (penicillin-binding protein 3)